MRYGEISSFQSGVAVPVFSLHSQDSVGIGEFLDLVPFGAWAKKCGLSIIQILPVNDTGFESSPYSARSAFALNPAFIRLQIIHGACFSFRFCKGNFCAAEKVCRRPESALFGNCPRKAHDFAQNFRCELCDARKKCRAHKMD